MGFEPIPTLERTEVLEKGRPNQSGVAAAQGTRSVSSLRPSACEVELVSFESPASAVMRAVRGSAHMSVAPRQRNKLSRASTRKIASKALQNVANEALIYVANEALLYRPQSSSTVAEKGLRSTV